jgi:hypothetical protein
MSKPRKKPVETLIDFVGATDIRVARGEVVTEGFVEDGCRGLRKRHRIDRLALYVERRTITAKQALAGRKFADDAEMSQVSLPSLLDDTRMGSGQGREDGIVKAGLAAHMAKRRIDKAVAAMGPTLAPVAIAVCLTNTAANAWAETSRLPGNDGAPLLRAALQCLVLHYGLDDLPRHKV